MYVLTSKWARELMAWPMGIAIGKEAPGSIQIVRQSFGDDVKLMTVGDVVTQNVISNWRRPDLAVIDLKTRRSIGVQDIVGFESVYTVKNPAGTLGHGAIEVVERAMHDVRRGRRALIRVDGEEDLMSLLIILEAPEKSLVLYGLYTGYLIVIPINLYYKFAILKLVAMMKPIKGGSGA